MSDLFKDIKTVGDEKEEEKKVEKALFFVVGDRATLLHEAGACIEADIEGCCGRESEAGPWDDLPEGEGLWIWEGIPGWSSGYTFEHGDEGGEPIYKGRGKARRPTVAELAIISIGPISELFGPPHLVYGPLDGQLPPPEPPADFECSVCGCRAKNHPVPPNAAGFKGCQIAVGRPT